MKRILLGGSKIIKHAHVRRALECADGWTIVDEYVEGCYVITAGLSKCPLQVRNVKRGFVPTGICIDNNPFGFHNYNQVKDKDWMYMVSVGSFVFGLALPAPMWDATRWETLSTAYGFPTPEGWKRAADGCVTVMLPRIHGWLYKNDAGGWKALVRRTVETIRENDPHAQIELRPHPKDASSNILSMLGMQKDKRVGVQKGPISANAARTRAVVTLWSTGFVQFVMHGGCPVFDLSDTKDSAAALVADPDLSHLRDTSLYRSPMSPRDFLNALAQRVFRTQDYLNGNFVRYLDAVTS
eukprot:jgi/Tetstr1/464146/TSEL_008951.t1